jgi:hypothetical protein
VNEERQRKLFEQFVVIEGDEFQFEVGRDRQTIARDGHQAGFSEDALDTLHAHLITFIGTRTLRYQHQHGVMPQQMTVRIRVSLDHQPAEFNDSMEVTELPPIVIEDKENRE